jgi:nitroreductase
VIDEYIRIHNAHDFNIEDTKTRFEPYRTLYTTAIGGTLDLRKEDILTATKGNFNDLVKMRFSTRDYSVQKVDVQLINQSIVTSMKTPSICNRQPWEVIVIQNKAIIDQVLTLQGGLTEHGSHLSTLLVVLSKGEYLMGPEERNQGYVDGGMFAMTLLYALHQNGLAVCPLNADFNRKIDRNLRTLLSISPHDSFIVMLSVGHYMESYKVPRSQRDDFSEITTYIL